MYGKSVRSNFYIDRTYRIEAEIGSGGSGAVYLAWHTRLRKHVVIKTAEGNSAGVLEVLRNEVEALKNIKSIYVPQILDFYSEKNQSFTVMEYISGESFDKLLKRGLKFSEKQILKWYGQLASALDTIHNNDVYHRDIKPSNIMLTKSGDVCLIDFNSAYVSGNNTGIISHSMGYASPEQYEFFTLCRSKAISYAKETDHIDTIFHRNSLSNTVPGEGGSKYPGMDEADWRLSDIYSLGATMYHFLTGKRPAARADEVEQIQNLIGYSKSLLGIIERSMRTDPSQRFTSAKDLGFAIENVICSN